MATFSSWIKADKPKEILPVPRTPDIYSRIKDMGLETVIWEEFSDININSIPKICKFIDKNKPCLFIFDPQSRNLQKGYLFNVNSYAEVAKWLLDNVNNLDRYNYLITSQINNPSFGFVGTAFSDGKGNLFSETYHRPKVCNQRELSQPKEEITPWQDCFTIDDYSCEVDSHSGNFLTQQDIREISEKYLDKEGYFELVKGEHLGKIGIYTTGYETFNYRMSFPERLHTEMHFSNLASRLNARNIKEY